MTPEQLRHQFDAADVFAKETWSNIKAVEKMRELKAACDELGISNCTLNKAFAHAIRSARETKSNKRLFNAFRALRKHAEQRIEVSLP